MSENTTGNASENTYEKLVSKVAGIDYIVGPGMKFMVQRSIKKTHSSELEKMCGCSGELKISCEEYNMSLLADFVYNLDKQAAQKFVPEPNALAVYFKIDTMLKNFNEYIATDDSGKKYIKLTEKGVALFKDIWNSGRTAYVNSQFVPFSTLEKDGFNIVGETEDANNKKAIYSQDEAELVKVGRGPSILVQNCSRSAGFTEEYFASDDSIVGSRNSVRGSNSSSKKF